MSAHHRDQHRTRLDYSSFIDALLDADQVVNDLSAIGNDQLLIRATDLDFTIRRLRVLLHGCIRSAREAGIDT